MFKLPSERSHSIGLLILRVSSGLIMMIFHGYSKITGGPDLWTKLGGAMSNLGITFTPTFWGFMSAFTEFVVPIFLIFGFLTCPAALLLVINMLVALTSHFTRLDPWGRIEFPMLLLFVYLALLIAGPGRYSIDALIGRRKKRKNEI